MKFHSDWITIHLPRLFFYSKRLFQYSNARWVHWDLLACHVPVDPAIRKISPRSLFLLRNQGWLSAEACRVDLGKRLGG